MSPDDVGTLATYNSECARGIVHTDAWRARMVALQRKFNLDTYGTEEPEPGKIYQWPPVKASESL